ncbi:uncharacterized protein UTRI_06192_B [Ustilago trichophora]|uniref:Uncharacterized protein n=1 Tax=Ustilago trichophora TaxID=86804 RepID=A0A5C3EH45_9BASI|nr:uncharacterized protein UTRI_06192_B [Ustilago trichophora]
MLILLPPFLLSILFLTAQTCFAAIDSLDVAVNQHRPYRAGTLSSQAAAQQEASEMERLLGIPVGHLQPIHAISPNDADAIARHLQSQDSRYMWVAGVQGQRASTFASPYTAERPGTGARERRVLFFRVHQRGIVVPMFHSGIREAILPGRQGNFWQYLNQHATMRKEELVRAFPGLRALGM